MITALVLIYAAGAVGMFALCMRLIPTKHGTRNRVLASLIWGIVWLPFIVSVIVSEVYKRWRSKG
jgi:hypothetical protein